MANPLKIRQIFAATRLHREGQFSQQAVIMEVLYAVCEDGTLWCLGVIDGKTTWTEIHAPERKE